MNNFKLRNNLHSDIWQLLEWYILMIFFILQTFLNIEILKKIRATIRHQYFSKGIWQFSWYNNRKPSVIRQIQWFNLLKDFKFTFKPFSFFFELKLLQKNSVLYIWFVFFDNVSFVSNFAKEYACLTAISQNFFYFEIVLMQYPIYLLRIILLFTCFTINIILFFFLFSMILP